MLNKRWSQQSYCSLSSPPPFEGPSSIREQRFEAASADGEYCIGKVNDLVGRCFEWRQRRQICSPSRRGQAHRNQLDEERDALIKEVSSLAQSFSISANPSGHVESYELIDKVKSQLTIPGENRSGAMQEMIHFYGKPEGTVVEQIENLKPIRYQLALAEVAIRLLHVDQLCLWTYLQEPVQIIQKWRHSALVREHAIRVSKRPGDWGGYEVTSLACVDAERLLEQTDDWATALDIEDDLTDDHKIALQNALKRQIPEKRPSMPAGLPPRQSVHEWLLENNRIRAASFLIMTKYAIVEHISALLQMPKAASITREHIEDFAASQGLYTADKIRQAAYLQMTALPKTYNNHQFWPDL